jgi:drug/metabolite transporter (DMT)-like permease
LRTFSFTLLALVAFAGNSLLCRLALRSGSIDPASFATIRLLTGAATLVLVRVASRPRHPIAGSWRSAAALFVYAMPFSFAYLGLTAGTGALILFGVVQLTMLLSALATGERPSARHWAGLVMAAGGLVYLVWPGLAAPSPGAATLMALAGIGWGTYSLQGKLATDPLADTTGNFARAAPFALIVSAVLIQTSHFELRGALFAAASGVFASGLGYVIWYAALSGLTKTGAALVQLAVPVIAAAAGAAFLSERLTSRFVISTVLILGGIAVALTRRRAD